jgi:hypothetical protein
MGAGRRGRSRTSSSRSARGGGPAPSTPLRDRAAARSGRRRSASARAPSSASPGRRASRWRPPRAPARRAGAIHSGSAARGLPAGARTSPARARRRRSAPRSPRAAAPVAYWPRLAAERRGAVDAVEDAGSPAACFVHREAVSCCSASNQCGRASPRLQTRGPRPGERPDACGPRARAARSSRVPRPEGTCASSPPRRASASRPPAARATAGRPPALSAPARRAGGSCRAARPARGRAAGEGFDAHAVRAVGRRRFGVGPPRPARAQLAPAALRGSPRPRLDGDRPSRRVEDRERDAVAPARGQPDRGAVVDRRRRWA